MFISKARHDREIENLNQTHAAELQKEREDAHERWSIEYHKRVSEEFTHNCTRVQLMATENLFSTALTEALIAKQENAIMRQILADLTGKSADELIEKYK